MENYIYITLRQRPDLKNTAAKWFSDKWSIPINAYLKCMDDYVNNVTEYGWYVCLLDNKIVGGLGVIDNDFHNRKDLTPNVCAVYTEEKHRNKGIAGNLLNMAIEDLRNKGISSVYLVTDRVGFYEKYGWKFICFVECNNQTSLSRMYIHQ